MSSYEKTYYDISHEAGFAGARNLLRVNKRGKRLDDAREKGRIYEWLSNQDAYTLHKPINRRFPRLRYDVSNIFDLWELDLMQLTSIKEHNDGYNYLLVAIDVLSKFAFVEPLREKTASSVAAAFKKILDRAKQTPILVQTDRGKEFVGSSFQALLKKYDIRFRVARNPDIKAAVVERLNRTIRERMWRYFTRNNTKRYIDIVQKLIHAYNHTVHSSTKMRPCDVTYYNAAEVRENLAKRSSQQTINKRKGKRLEAKYKVGDYVRISRTKNTFERGYEKNFSEEIFKVVKVSSRQNTFTYVIQDLNDELIDGFFYDEELALVGKERVTSDVFEIERVLETKGRGKNKRVLVKWKGWPDKFNSWIDASELKNIQNE